ncbi:MAG: glycosyltransferase [Chitinophagales bacterium]|nr:glycosyltransferase [Chitinophagales bacterium]MDW8273902.1 glycosyltransferase [Chitinophagales bacterium]
MKKFKILCCVTNDLSCDQRMQRICDSLAEWGYNVILFGRELKHSFPLQTTSYSQKRVRCFFNKGKIFYAEYNIRLFFYLVRERPNVVHAVDLDTAPAVMLALLFFRLKIVYDAHELFTEVPEVVRRPAIRKIWHIIQQRFVPRANVVLTVSESIADYFRINYNAQVYVVRNLPVLRPVMNKTRQRAIIYQGALNEGRGLEILIESMQYIDAQLWIAGDGDISEILKKLVEEYNLSFKVFFLGRLLPDELREKTESAYIGYNVLEHKGKSYFYSLGNKTFDYIHAGIPQLISPFPEMKRLNEQYAFAIEIQEISTGKIIEAVNRLLNDSALYEQLKNNCMAAKQVLNWQNESSILKSAYERVLR